MLHLYILFYSILFCSIKSYSVLFYCKYSILFAIHDACSHFRSKCGPFRPICVGVVSHKNNGLKKQHLCVATAGQVATTTAKNLRDACNWGLHGHGPLFSSQLFCVFFLGLFWLNWCFNLRFWALSSFAIHIGTHHQSRDIHQIVSNDTTMVFRIG